MIREIPLWTIFSFLLRRKRCCIFFLRGGLGNQLFQILGLIEISKRENFTIIFSDADVRKNPRDKNGAAAFKLRFAPLIEETNQVFKSNFLLDLILRIIRSNKIRKISLHNINFDKETSGVKRLVFTGNGYLQNPKNISELLSKYLPINLNQYDAVDRKSEIAIHIRATDSLENIAMSINDTFYQNALGALTAGKSSVIDVYSDDLDFAKKLCAKLGDHHFKFIEENQSLEAIELLATISNYKSIVSSKSTLCWWACFFATAKNKKVKIISPWQGPLHQAAWN
jgi:hypothetical protein